MIVNLVRHCCLHRKCTTAVQCVLLCACVVKLHVLSYSCLSQHCLLIGEINSYMYNKCCSSSKLWKVVLHCISKKFPPWNSLRWVLSYGFCSKFHMPSCTAKKKMKSVNIAVHFLSIKSLQSTSTTLPSAIFADHSTE